MGCDTNVQWGDDSQAWNLLLQPVCLAWFPQILFLLLFRKKAELLEISITGF